MSKVFLRRRAICRKYLCGAGLQGKSEVLEMAARAAYRRCPGVHRQAVGGSFQANADRESHSESSAPHAGQVFFKSAPMYTGKFQRAGTRPVQIVRMQWSSNSFALE